MLCHGGCQCACSFSDAKFFITHLPGILRRREHTPGWHEYLDRIYGEVHYPFDMTQLGMLYFRTSMWGLNASGWPVLACEARTGFAEIPNDVRYVEPQTTCDARSSSMSKLLPVDERGARRNTRDDDDDEKEEQYVDDRGLRLETFHETEVQTSNIGLVAAIRWWWTPVAADRPQSVPQSSSPVYLGSADYSWVEVTRWAAPMEGGQPRFGTWFHRAPGSGIFLNVGRSYRIASKGKFLPGKHGDGSNSSGDAQYLQLIDAWRESRARRSEDGVADGTRGWSIMSREQAGRIAGEWARNGSLQVWGDAFALMALELGFETVQVGDGSDGARAGVPSLQIVHLSPPSHGPSAKDRPPRFVSGRPRMGACGVGINLRRGWRQQWACKCDPRKAILNCDG